MKTADEINAEARIAELEAELEQLNAPKKYVTQGGVIFCLHGTSSISAYEHLEAERDASRLSAAGLREALEKIAKASVFINGMVSEPDPDRLCFARETKEVAVKALAALDEEGG